MLFKEEVKEKCESVRTSGCCKSTSFFKSLLFGRIFLGLFWGQHGSGGGRV